MSVGPNRNRFRLAIRHWSPETPDQHRENLVSLERGFEESLINLEVGAAIRRATTQSIPHNTTTKVILDTVIEDDYGFFANNALVVPRGLDGRYMILQRVEFPSAAYTNCQAATRQNVDGTNYRTLINEFEAGTQATLFRGWSTAHLNTGDQIELWAYQVSGGGAQNLTVSTNDLSLVGDFSRYQPSLEMWRIARKG